jgi:RHS repeat-associated protein
MVKQVNPDGSKTIFVGGVYEETRNSLNAVTRTVVYYPAGGAMRVTEGAASNVYYMLKDHLGSASALTDSSGNVVDEQRYMPFGQPRLVNANLLTDRLFTGQRNLPSLGLMDYKARMYSPSLGRFIQPDTIVPNPMNPQSFNRYSYVNNSPLNFTDPSGHCPEEMAECREILYSLLPTNTSSGSNGNSGSGGCTISNLAGCYGGTPTPTISIPGGVPTPPINVGTPTPDELHVILGNLVQYKEKGFNPYACYATEIGIIKCAWMKWVLPNWESVPYSVTTADVHGLTSSIQTQNWKAATIINTGGFADQSGVTDLISLLSGWFDDPFGTSAFADTIDNSLLEYSVQTNHAPLLVYSSSEYGGRGIEGKLTISAEGYKYGPISITLTGQDVINANLWFHQAYGP